VPRQDPPCNPGLDTASVATWLSEFDRTQNGGAESKFREIVTSIKK
jgi:hypothetical protein